VVAVAVGEEAMPKPPGASSMVIFDQSAGKISGWKVTIPIINNLHFRR